MTLLIDIYYHHRLPKDEPELVEKHRRIIWWTKDKLSKMQEQTAPKKPATPIEEIHALIQKKACQSWVTRLEFLHQQFTANALVNWPLDAQQLLAELFPTGQARPQLTSNEARNIFKALTAIMLHLTYQEETPPA